MTLLMQLFFFFRFDFDEAAFSPPSYDDSFFYVRYPRSQNSQPQHGLKHIVTEVLNENIASSANQITNEKSISDLKEVKQIDFSKHPLPCQPFIPIVNEKGILSKILFSSEIHF